MTVVRDEGMNIMHLCHLKILIFGADLTAEKEEDESEHRDGNGNYNHNVDDDDTKHHQSKELSILG